MIFLAVAAAASLSAAQITGKVRDASGDNATVVIDGDALPAVGDSAEIFFKIQGADEEISVASGKVASVEGKVVSIKIDKATGTIEKDQLARIKSGSSPKASGASPGATSSPSATAATDSSIIGDWESNLPEGRTFRLSFKEDGTLLWVTEEAQFAEWTGGKYRIDSSTQPQGIELSELEEREEKGIRLRGIFELQSDGRLKLDFARDDAPPPKEFSKEALVFSKATSPVVRPNKPPPPRPTPYVAPTPAPDAALVTEGIKRYDSGDDTGAIEVLDKAIALNPKNATAFFYRGMCFHRKKDWAAAVADYEKAQELDPSMKLEELIAKTKIVRGNEPAKSGPSPKPTTLTTPSPEVRKLIDKGIALKDLGELDAAVKALTQAIKLDPKAVDAYWWRGSCYDLKNDHAAAIRDWTEVGRLDPSQRESREKLMQELHWQDKAKKEQQSKKR